MWGSAGDIAPMNLFEAVEQQARARPHAAAIVGADQTLHFDEVVELARRVAGALRKRGIGESDVVGVMLGNTGVHLLVLLALARLGRWRSRCRRP